MIGLVVFLPLVFLGLLIVVKKPIVLNLTTLFACLVSSILILFLFEESASFKIDLLFGLSLNFKADGLRLILGFLTAMMFSVTTFFNLEYFKKYLNQKRYYIALLITFSSTLGVFFSADIFTLFIFFEVMSFSSFFLVIHDETREAIKASKTYLAVSVFGGLVTLFGIFMMYQKYNVLDFVVLKEMIVELSLSDYVIFGLTSVGFLAKAGFFPLHIWLPKAHPVAPAPASAILSGILTKAGVFGLIIIGTNVFLGDYYVGLVMVSVATITMFLGAVLAFFSSNIKRTLACSSLSQIGFIGVGLSMAILLGSHNSIASAGYILHIFNHSLLKLILFCLAGIVYMNLHSLDYNEIRGFGRKKYRFMFLFVVAMLAIGGIPLFSSYVSKTLIHEAILEYIHLDLANVLYFKFIEIIFIISGGLTLAYMMKMFKVLFIDKPSDLVKKHKSEKYLSQKSFVAFLIPLGILIILGILPNKIGLGISNFAASSLNSETIESIPFFNFVNLKGAIYSIVISIIVYLGLVHLKKEKKYQDWIIENIDLEKFYVLVIKFVHFIAVLVFRLISDLMDILVYSFRKFFINQENIKKDPKSDDKFTIYDESARYGRIFNEELAYSLLMITIGLALGLLYIFV